MSALGKDQVFMDVESVSLGSNLVDEITAAVASAYLRTWSRRDVVLAVIGKDWVSATDDSGARRLANENEFVRLELAAALRRGLRVIPVLVGGASMPTWAAGR